jgi:hypothetical protein
VLVEHHANKNRQGLGVEKAIGLVVAGDGEISLYGAMIARDRTTAVELG